ncbi:MAG TPA: hypothetical protein VFL84_13955 [Gammaproteobacteria bacterium]|nr:hypothetical protein [Gammaproteobacteria bacterium]
MSEWIDFAVYVTLIVLIFVLLPRHGRQFTLPMIADRNPDWPARNRDVVARLERSRWFLNACYVWAVVSIVVLLGVQLGLIAPPLDSNAPKWEILKDVNSTFLILGLLCWGVCWLLWVRWLATHVPPAETRRATLKPRVIGDYLSVRWRVAVDALTVLHLSTWVVIGALGLAGGAKFWGSFAFFMVMTLAFRIFGYLAPRRRPGYLDRLFGEAYRRSEIGLAYFMRLWPAASGAIVLAELTTGADLDRAAQLLVVSFVCVLALMILRLRPVAPGTGPVSGHGPFASERRSPA